MLVEGERAYHVLTVRSRLDKGEVDVIYPVSDHRYQLLTVHMSNKLVGGWRVTDARAWNIERQPLPPSFAPPAPKPSTGGQSKPSKVTTGGAPPAVEETPPS